MSEYAILAWFLLASLVGLNLIAAGVSALLHIRRSEMRRRNRILWSASSAGLFPASMIMAAQAEELAYGLGYASTLGLLVAIALMFILGAAVSLPLAMWVTRRLDGPGQDFLTFE